MSKPIHKLDLDYFETVLLYNALSDPEYLSSIVSYVEPSFFNDKHIGKIIEKIAQFFNERGTIPSIVEIKTRLTSEDDQKSLSEVKATLSSLQGPFNKDELILNTEKFLILPR